MKNKVNYEELNKIMSDMIKLDDARKKLAMEATIDKLSLKSAKKRICKNEKNRAKITG